jgi:hypothetical protein
MDFSKITKDYYLFGSFKEMGNGEKSTPRFLLPAPTPISQTTAGRRWKKLSQGRFRNYNEPLCQFETSWG